MTENAEKPQILLKHHLKQLKLPTFLAEYEKQARECAEAGVDHIRYLLRLAELELIERERRMVERRIRAAKFPAVKSLDSFDFMAIPSLNKMLVLELARGEYVLRRENVIARRRAAKVVSGFALVRACDQEVAGLPGGEPASTSPEGPREQRRWQNPYCPRTWPGGLPAWVQCHVHHGARAR